MGEAKRKKAAGNSESNPKYRKNKRMPKYQIERVSNQLASEMFGGLLRTYPRLPRV